MRKLVLLTAVLLTTLFSTEILAQSEKVSINRKNEAISTILKDIESQTEILFVYKSDVNVKEAKSVNVSKAPVTQVLNTLFAGTSIKYEFTGKNVILSNRQTAQAAVSGPVRISGIVVDEAGAPVIGAGVVETSSAKSNGVITDIDGRFSITVNQGASIQVSCIGYETQSLAIGNRTAFNIVLREDRLLLDEVVVVGYGVQKKVNLSGAVDAVSNKVLESRPVISPGAALQGAVANLNVTTYGSDPLDAPSMNIRGYTSVNGGSPLYVIDGIQSTSESFAHMNPGDIESISVLKDAAACAIYGSQAAFGVILVTTKSGAKEKVKITYNGSMKLRSFTKRPLYELDPYTVATLTNEFAKPWYVVYDSNMVEAARVASETGETQVETESSTGTWRYLSATNWMDECYKNTAFSTQHNVAVSGGTDMAKYYVSAGYDFEDGMLKYGNDQWNQYNVLSKVDFKLADWWTMSANLNMTKYDYDQSLLSYQGNLYRRVAYYQSTLNRPFHEDGTLTGYGANCIGRLMSGSRAITDRTSMTAQFSTKIDLVKDILFVNGTFKYYNYLSRVSAYQLPVYYYDVPASAGGEEKYLPATYGEKTYADESFAESRRNIIDVYASYQQTLAKKHFLAAVAGFNQEDYDYEHSEMKRYNLTSTLYPTVQLASGEQYTEQSKTSWATRGFFGRINYIYDNRYIFEANARYDGTSRFRKDNRWAFNPSASIAWNVANEKWFKPLNGVINQFKIRASYGSLGNQDVSAYAYIDTMSSSVTSYIFDGKLNKYMYEGSLVAGNLTWETVRTKNVGVDLGFFQNKLTLTADAYIRETLNMLSTGQTVPSFMAASAPDQNSADLETKGFEFTAQWRDAFNLGGKPFHYGVKFNLSDSRAWITRWVGNDAKSLSYNYVGKELGEIWGYNTLGFFESYEDIENSPSQAKCLSYSASPWAPGDLKFEDRDDNGEIYYGKWTLDDPGDAYVIGNTRARYRYGINLDAEWNGFDFSVFLQGVGKQDYYPGTSDLCFWGLYNEVWLSYLGYGHAHDSWTEENPDAYYPRHKSYTAYLSWKELSIPQTRYLQNLAYLRLKNLSVGYTIPERLTQKVNIQKLRLYFSGDNLGVLSKMYKYYSVDPENAGSYYYPNLKYFSFGVNVTF